MHVSTSHSPIYRSALVFHLMMPALVTILCLALPMPAAALSGLWRPQPGSLSLLSRVRVVCSRERHGNVITTHFCNDGYECLPGGKCGPGPAMRRQIEQRIKALNEAIERNRREAEAAAEAARRRAEEAARPPAPASQAGVPAQAAPSSHIRTSLPPPPGSRAASVQGTPLQAAPSHIRP